MDYLQVRMIYLTNQSDSLEIEIIWGTGGVPFPTSPKVCQDDSKPPAQQRDPAPRGQALDVLLPHLSWTDVILFLLLPVLR